ncbi:MAG: CDP-alcohol phosphatidyltransferase family protein [Clostridia bacterium]|nr:CDP-alcohol phosphatidyltransferase family protein [Clostridia bacterium]
MANVITAGRIILSLPLLCIPLSSVWFYVLYLFCGLTDMVDGAIARKTGTVSQFGARLDTVSDFVFMLICCVRILPRMHLPVWLWAWIIMVALMKAAHIVFVLIRKKKLLSNHNVLNKITGFALFLLPLTLDFVETSGGVAAICVVATLAVMQEMYDTAKGKEVL